jgi:hypothetical protein
MSQRGLTSSSSIISIPESLPQIEPAKDVAEVGSLTGLQFVYTAHALGLSVEAQDKLIDLVDGRGMRAAGGGGRLKWPNVSSLLADLHANRRNDLRFGPNVAEELRIIALDTQSIGHESN